MFLLLYTLTNLGLYFHTPAWLFESYAYLIILMARLTQL